MPRTSAESEPSRRKRRRAVFLAAAMTLAFGPWFLLAFSVGQARRIGAEVGISEAFLAEHIRLVIGVAILFALIASNLSLALLKRRFPPREINADIPD